MANTPIARWPSASKRRTGFPTAMFPRKPRRNPDRQGFALVTVIWSLGLISLLGMAVIVGARYRTRTTVSLASLERSSVAAESAINLAIVRAMATPAGQKPSFPLRCRLPGGEFATISIEDEATKVDLNTATPAIMIQLFTVLTRDQSIGARIAGRIVALRTPTSGQPGNPQPDKKAAFTTILQLDQIEEISPRLFRRALPLVTVLSGRTEPVAVPASSALREMLKLSGTTVESGNAVVPANVTIRADIEAAHGARFIREALVSFGDHNGRPFVIHEWRRGDVDRISDGNDNAERPRDCFQVAGRRDL